MEAFFNDMSVPAKFLFAFIVVLAVLGIGGYLMRRFTGGALAVSGPRGRQPRLAVIDAASVDGRRRLVLVRRDNVEHLLLIGGPTDIVVEPNIAKNGAAASPAITTATAAATPASGFPSAASSVTDAMPPVLSSLRDSPVLRDKSMPAIEPPLRRPMPLDDSNWSPPPPEPAYVEPLPPPSLREPNLRPPPVPIERQRLGSYVEDAGAPPLLPTPPDPEPVLTPPPVPPAFEPVFHIPPAPEPRRMPSAPPLPPRTAQSEESNLAEMAQRLEAALRRPIKPAEPVLAPPPPPSRFAPESPSAPEPSRAPSLPDFAAVAPAAIRDPEPPQIPKQPELTVVPADSSARPAPVFTSIEEEMASLLGRAPGKS